MDMLKMHTDTTTDENTELNDELTMPLIDMNLFDDDPAIYRAELVTQIAGWKHEHAKSMIQYAVHKSLGNAEQCEALTKYLENCVKALQLLQGRAKEFNASQKAAAKKG
jgi:hypothetical protein